MKTFYLFLLLTLSNFCFAQWDTIFYNPEMTVNDFFFFDRDEGFITANQYWATYILKTVDGGQNWHAYTEERWLRRIFFINKDIGYIGAHDCCVYKTIDGGQSWFRPDNNSYGWTDVNYIFFFDEFTGHIDYKWTYDGGLNWTNSNNYFLRIIKTDDTTAYGAAAYNKGILKTTDKGETWELHTEFNGLSDLFLDQESHGIAIFDDGYILHSYDTFNTFTDSIFIDQSRLIQIDFNNTTNGFILSYSPYFNYKIFYTEDGGYNWNLTDIIYREDKRVKLECIDEQTTFLSQEYNGCVLRSKDGPGPTTPILPKRPIANNYNIFYSGEVSNVSMDTDSIGNIYLTGYYSDSLVVNDINLQAQYQSNIFICKLNQDLQIEWITTAGSSCDEEIFPKISVLPDGQSMVCGNFQGNLYFADTVINLPENDFHLFISHLDKNGHIKSIEILTSSYPLYGFDINNNKEDKFFIIGRYRSYISLNNDTLSTDYSGVYLINKDISNNLQEIISIAKNSSYESLLYSSLHISFSKNTGLIIGDCYHYDIEINDSVYEAHERTTYFLLNMDNYGGFNWIRPEVVKGKSLLLEIADMVIEEDELICISGWFPNYLIYGNDTITNLSFRQQGFYAELDNYGNIENLILIGSKPGETKPFQITKYGDYQLSLAHMDNKTPFRNYNLYNIGNLSRADLAFCFYNDEGIFTDIYQLVDHSQKATVKQINDEILLAGSSIGIPMEFDNITLGEQGQNFYYITKLDMQSLEIPENIVTELPQLIIYPNPTKQQFGVEFQKCQEYGTLSIYTIEGKIISERKITNSKTILVDELLPPGIYLVRFRNNSTSITKKVVIQ